MACSVLDDQVCREREDVLLAGFTLCKHWTVKAEGKRVTQKYSVQPGDHEFIEILALLMINMGDGSLIIDVNIQSIRLEVLRNYLSRLNDSRLLGQIRSRKSRSIRSTLSNLLSNKLVRPLFRLGGSVT